VRANAPCVSDQCVSRLQSSHRTRNGVLRLHIGNPRGEEVGPGFELVHEQPDHLGRVAVFAHLLGVRAIANPKEEKVKPANGKTPKKRLSFAAV
jgi:hypothetical protein